MINNNSIVSRTTKQRILGKSIVFNAIFNIRKLAILQQEHNMDISQFRTSKSMNPKKPIFKCANAVITKTT